MTAVRPHPMVTRASCCAFLLAALGSGCAWSRPAALVQAGQDDPGTPIPGLDVCDRNSPGVLKLDPSRPLTVFVHGCKDSGGRFRELAQVFEAHGQQTACFNYNHRDTLAQSSAELARALEALETRLRPGRVTVLAHSQGGLVARRALVTDRTDGLRVRDGFTFRLFTVSSPFGGIRSASDCGKTWLHVLTLGVTVGICQLVAGSNWTEIPPGSGFMTHPGTLLPQVEEVGKVVTDERGSCRTVGAEGSCKKSDFVFSLDEQRSVAVDDDPRLHVFPVAAGHVEIVGGDGAIPTKLIALLQERGVLAQTPPERREEIAALVQRLFGGSGSAR